MILASGVDYPIFPAFREAAASIQLRNDELALLGVALGRAIWRQLSAITVKRLSDGEPLGGPAALRNDTGAAAVTLWIGALATDKAKIEDLVSATYDIPANMFLFSSKM